jgi:hypothetical protein
MRAQAGDWLVVEQASIGHEARRGLIEEVRSSEGSPPYLVRWLDTGHEALVFPGPDAHVQTHEEFEVADERTASRVAAMQREIDAHRGRP